MKLSSPSSSENEYNRNIDKNFEDPEYQKNVLNPLLKAQEKSLKLIKGLIFIVLGLAIIGNIYISNIKTIRVLK